MKKILLSVIITVCVMTGIGYGIITNITNNYEEKMENIKVESEEREAEREAEIAELKSDVTEISDQVFNMMNGDAYEITIDHDGETHTWKSDNKGLFKRELHSVIY